MCTSSFPDCVIQVSGTRGLVHQVEKYTKFLHVSMEKLPLVPLTNYTVRKDSVVSQKVFHELHKNLLEHQDKRFSIENMLISFQKIKKYSYSLAITNASE